VALIPLLDSGSLPHRLCRGSRILSRHERERRGAGHTFVGRGTPRGCWRRRGRHGDCRCQGGAGGGSNEIPVTFESPTALTGDGGGVGRRCGASGEQSRRWLRLTTRSARVWGVGGVYGTINLVISVVGPHLLLYGAGRWRAHQPSGLDAPDQGVFMRARPDSDLLGSGSAGDQTNSSDLDFLCRFSTAHSHILSIQVGGHESHPESR
jgi:hypothetical protein